MSKAFQKAKFYQNSTSGSGSKQRFSLLQEKAVIQEKSENFNSLRPILFELCKKNYRNRVKYIYFVIHTIHIIYINVLQVTLIIYNNTPGHVVIIVQLFYKLRQYIKILCILKVF